MKSMLKQLKQRLIQFRAIFFIIGLTTAGVIGIVTIFDIANSRNLDIIACSGFRRISRL